MSQRLAQWNIDNDLPITIPAAKIKTARGVQVTPSAITARLFASGSQRPPVPITGRSNVNVTLDGDAYYAAIPYGTDLDALPAVRLIVTATVAGRPARLVDAEVTFVRPEGR